MKTTKQMAILLVIAFFAASTALATFGVTNPRIEVKRMLSNARYQPPTTPQVGGQTPGCPSGATCN